VVLWQLASGAAAAVQDEEQTSAAAAGLPEPRLVYKPYFFS